MIDKIVILIKKCICNPMPIPRHICNICFIGFFSALNIHYCSSRQNVYEMLCRTNLVCHSLTKGASLYLRLSDLKVIMS
jgi:hypothetical protein